MEQALAGGDKAIVELMMATYAGMTTAAFEEMVRDWLATARHPRFDRRMWSLSTSGCSSSLPICAPSISRRRPHRARDLPLSAPVDRLENDRCRSNDRLGMEIG